MSVRGLLEQGPAATEEAASFGGDISFGGEIKFWQKEDRAELRRRSMFSAGEQSRKP